MKSYYAAAGASFSTNYAPFPSFSALVWGASVKHNPQKVGKDHVLDDEDVIQLVKK